MLTSRNPLFLFKPATERVGKHNPFNPDPKSIVSSKPVEAAPAAQPQLPLTGAQIVGAGTDVLPAAPKSTSVRIALIQGDATVSSTDAQERPFASGSRGFGMYAKQLLTAGKALTLQIGGSTMSMQWRSFSSGSWGWYAGGKVEINGKRYQISGNVTANGSKLTGQPADGQAVVGQVTISIIEIGSKPKA